MRPFAALLVATFLLARPASAQAGRTGAILLELPASTRALALGNSFVAAGADESSIFYNPAQLADVPHAAVGLSVQQWLESSTLAALAGGTRVFGGTLAVGLQVLDYGSSEVVLGDGSATGGVPTGTTVSAGDYVVSAGYALSVHGVRVGATGKYVAERLASESGSTGAADIGLAFDVLGATVGAAVQNLGGEIGISGEKAPLPRTARLGLAVPVRGLGPVDIVGTAEMVKPRFGNAQASGGVEVTYKVENGLDVIGRVGALARPSQSEWAPISFGGGVRWNHLALDYAYQSVDVFGAMHRVGLRWWR